MQPTENLFPPVSVGKTDFPLRPLASDPTPVPLFEPNTSASAFRLLDGPPYANGAPHLGHVLNKHLKDAVARAASLSGFAVDWRPGWDCHGLPLELAVEKLGAKRADRADFVARAREFASNQAAHQSHVFQAQGWSASWDRPWHTQDPGMEAGTLRVLADLVDADLVQARFTAVPWCAACRSTLSGAEQEDKSLTVSSWLVPFDLGQNECLLSWTTTPWTLPLHAALVVNPQAVYVALELQGLRAWVSEDTSTRWQEFLGASRTEDRMLGSQLKGRAYATPWKTDGRVLADPSCLSQAGTGVLHAVPGLAELDTVLGRALGLPLVQYLTPEGLVCQSPCADQNGLPAGPKASACALPNYEQSPWFRVLPYTTEHPHCWRHHTPVLTRASRQVFLGLTQEVRARAEGLVERMQFTPEAARNRLLAAMRTRPDWCLSRQRTWGVPLCLFLDKQTGQPHARAAALMRLVASQFEERGVEAWWETSSSDWLKLLNSSDHLSSPVSVDDVERVDDVLDVWFDSGCVPLLVGEGDVVVEGTDQHRGWFQSCVWLSAALDRPLPFKRVVSHGFVVDAAGDKLSKSKGGDTAAKEKPGKPVPKWDQLPTDVVRVWALSGTEGHDKAWSADSVQAAQGAVSRWRGLLRFLLSNALPEPQDPRLLEKVPAWDRYWWSECSQVANSVVSSCMEGKTGQAVQQAQAFGELFSALPVAGWKDRLYCAPASTQERQVLDLVVRGCLHQFERMMQVLAPRLARDARAFWPKMDASSQLLPSLSDAERTEVRQVCALRNALGPVAETYAQQKGGPGLLCVAGWTQAPSWPGQLLADALGVGQVSTQTQGLDAVKFGAGVVYLGRSQDPCCPRCRRVQAAWEGPMCGVCQVRTQ